MEIQTLLQKQVASIILLQEQWLILLSVIKCGGFLQIPIVCTHVVLHFLSILHGLQTQQLSEDDLMCDLMCGLGYSEVGSRLQEACGPLIE